MNTIVNDEIRSEAQNRFLFEIDEILQEIPTCKHSDVPKKMIELSEAILSYLDQPITEDSLMYIFDQSLSQKDRRFVAVCLLRVIKRIEQVYKNEREFRIRVYTLFDQAFSRDIYHEVGIDSLHQNYQKIINLGDVPSDAEAILGKVIESLRDLNRLEEFRADLMKAFSHPLVLAVMKPFIPRQLIYKARISEIIESLRDYRQADVSHLVEAYDKAKEKIDAYKDEAQSFPTMFCLNYLYKFAEKLSSILENEFLSSDVAQPVELTVVPLEKKYPFHQFGAQVSLRFQVNNKGPGYAFDVELSADSNANIELINPKLDLGLLGPGSIIADFQARVIESANNAQLIVTANWAGANRLIQDFQEIYELEGQRTDLNWSSLELEDPYSLEPVEDIELLVGRQEIINQLIRQSRSRNIGSAYIYGQKRVGKTSIAKAFKSRLEQIENILVVYLDGGEYVHPDPQLTLSNLGAKLCDRIKKSDSRLINLCIPEFNGALSPLSNFLDLVKEIIPDFRALVILDEFDELPIDLYRRGSLGDAFFLTLRTISGNPSFGFILIGGEKMEFINSCQGEQINKFETIIVDYFDREQYWSDFNELVRRPTKNWLEITDDAIIALYEQTAGNPYYTMVVCRSLLSLMLQRRDYSVTRREIQEATEKAMKKIACNGFQHFWEDGIFESTGDRVEEISMRRRRILIGLANVLREKNNATKADIEKQYIIYPDLEHLDNELRSFLQRRVLVEHGGMYECKVPFFKGWLINSGVSQILTTFSDLDTILERKKREEQDYVKPEEIVVLVSKWGLYQGKRITEDQVRAWLSQFGDLSNQRKMFKILQGITYFSNDKMRECMREAHGIVTRGLGRTIKYRQRKRGDIIISYLDGPGKSGGGKYAKLYADENEIYSENVIERSKLISFFTQDQDVQALIFLDDFIGSGSSACEQFSSLANDIGDQLRELKIKLFFIAVTGFQNRLAKVEEHLEKLNLPISVRICHPLDSSNHCFGIDSRIFPDELERLQAMRIAEEIGRQLVKTNPLGYGNCQSTVIFPDSCPNNNLPILWAESETPHWRPLFKRPIGKY
ncbi:MAG: hypothetical protein A2Z16_17005 [Chloroflexi bacterium RBG_16_54_18]|nr:MAG: hypothetical protein A2Z16_17005 [Chloroflexi bacterium RBG_16_54_18]